MSEKKFLILTGIIIGAISVALTVYGNPGNMGFCIACFIRDTAGSLKLHSAPVVQYMRPEIIGLVLGAALSAIIRREFTPKGGSSPLIRFVVGFFVMLGALVFLGCPFRMILRLAGGDLNAVAAVAGFVAGIGAGVFFLKRGFSLNRAYPQSKIEGLAFSVLQIVFLVVFAAAPALLVFSASGPGSMHAPFLLSLGAGLVVGFFAQKSRLCMAGGIRDLFLFKDVTLLLGFLAIFVAALIANLAVFKFQLGFEGQPVAHTQQLWNFLGMSVVGFGSVLLGGCPLRQLILSGEGNTDSAMTILGFAAGAAFAHNFSLASSGAGATTGGKAAVIAGLVILTLIAFFGTFKKGDNK